MTSSKKPWRAKSKEEKKVGQEDIRTGQRIRPFALARGESNRWARFRKERGKEGASSSSDKDGGSCRNDHWIIRQTLSHKEEEEGMTEN